MNRILTNKWTKVVVFLLCLVPIGILAWEGPTGWGANPTQYLEHATGDWILRFLAITLAVTPLRKIFGLTQLIRFRRMFGLFAFFYACLHFCLYIGLDQVLDFHGIWADGLSPLADAASSDLCERRSRSDSFLLAGEIRYSSASRICGHHGRSAG